MFKIWNYSSDFAVNTCDHWFPCGPGTPCIPILLPCSRSKADWARPGAALASPLPCRSWSAGWTLCPPGTGSPRREGWCHTWTRWRGRCWCCLRWPYGPWCLRADTWWWPRAPASDADKSLYRHNLRPTWANDGFYEFPRPWPSVIDRLYFDDYIKTPSQLPFQRQALTERFSKSQANQRMRATAWPHHHHVSCARRWRTKHTVHSRFRPANNQRVLTLSHMRSNTTRVNTASAVPPSLSSVTLPTSVRLLPGWTTWTNHSVCVLVFNSGAINSVECGLLLSISNQDSPKRESLLEHTSHFKLILFGTAARLEELRTLVPLCFWPALLTSQDIF